MSTYDAELDFWLPGKEVSNWRERVESKVLPNATSPCSDPRRLTQLCDEVMEPTGLRFTQFHVLSELERQAGNPPTISELAKILTMERSVLTQTLRPLERGGFVSLGRDQCDAWRRPVQLTAAGLTILVHARPFWAGSHSQLERGFDDTTLLKLKV